MRRKFIWPTGVALLSGAILWVVGVRHFMTWATLVLAVFAVGLLVGEFWRPARARREAHGESLGTALLGTVLKNRRRFGGYTVHFGIVVMAVGIALSSTYRKETEVTLRPGESTIYAGYAIRLDSLYAGREPHRDFVEAAFAINGGGGTTEMMRPRINYYPRSDQPIGTPSVRTRPTEDLYLSLMAYSQDGANATVNVIVNPMVVWIWIGGAIVALGALFAISTVGFGAERARRATPALEPRGERLGAGVGGTD